MSKKVTLGQLNKTVITLTQLRDMASELGFELMYDTKHERKGSNFMNQIRKSNPIKVATSDYDPNRPIGLMKDGKPYLSPIRVPTLYTKLFKAIQRRQKINEKTK